MQLADLRDVARAELTGDGSVRVTGATLDSRRAEPGFLYAALPGARAHGADFAAQAAQGGAVAVLTDPAGAARLDVDLPVLVTADPRAVLGEVAAAVYGRPGRGLQLLGVTGTNGKTTVTYLLDAALTALGATTGLVGTVETRVAGERVPSVRTTPESPDLQRLFRRMVDASVDVCSMEVSSHALVLHRVDGAVFDVAGFTNLSQDHLDFHPTMDDYFAAKASLFTPQRARRAVVCIDDEWGRRLAAQAPIPVTTVTTTGAAVAEAAAAWRAEPGQVAQDGTTEFTVVSDTGRRYALRSPLPGAFNVANTALAFAMLTEAGFGAADVVRALADAGGVPGRMERVVLADASGWPQGQPLAVVDYAHTPSAVAAALQALRPATSGRLVIVLGAGGDRDPSKRQAMGRAAAAGADLVIVTDDNPRSEDPAAIRAAVLAGAGGSAREVPDRADAIAEAVAVTRGPADTIVVTGKGHETGQDIGGQIHPFDDRQVLHEALSRPRPERNPA